MARETTPKGAETAQPAYTPSTESRRDTGMKPGAEAGADRERAIRTGREGMAPARRPEAARGEMTGWAQHPFGLMQRLADDMDNLFNQFGFGRMMGMRPMLGRESAMETAWTPQVEVVQRDDHLVVRADLPGVKKEDVHVDVENDMLTIRGERRDEREEKDKGYFRSERSYGSFYRAMPLPEGVNPDACEAAYKDGVLEIRIPTPKQEERKGRRIEIR